MKTEMPDDRKEIQLLKTNLVKNILSVELIKLPALYQAIVYEILVQNKTYAQVALIHHIPQHKVKTLFMQSYKRLTDGITDLHQLLSQFKEIQQKNDFYEMEATYFKKGLITEKNYIESFGIEYTPELATLLARNICDTGLEERILNVCRAHDIETIKDLLVTGRSTIYNTRNCGKKTMTALDKYIESKGLFWFA